MSIIFLQYIRTFKKQCNTCLFVCVCSTSMHVKVNRQWLYLYLLGVVICTNLSAPKCMTFWSSLLKFRTFWNEYQCCFPNRNASLTRFLRSLDRPLECVTLIQHGLILCGIDSLLCIICDNIMINGHFILCPHVNFEA